MLLFMNPVSNNPTVEDFLFITAPCLHEEDLLTISVFAFDVYSNLPKEEEWGRSVVLFNTWNEPPIGLPFENENNNLHPSDDIEQIPYYCNKMNEWSRVGPSSNPTECNSASKEVSYLSQGTTIIDDEMTTKKEKKLSAKIWLLGDYRRRDHRLQTVHLEATESLREALYQETDVMSTKLQIPVSI